MKRAEALIEFGAAYAESTAPLKDDGSAVRMEWVNKIDELQKGGYITEKTAARWDGLTADEITKIREARTAVERFCRYFHDCPTGTRNKLKASAYALEPFRGRRIPRMVTEALHKAKERES